VYCGDIPNTLCLAEPIIAFERFFARLGDELAERCC
jgi:hypothetical protein